MSLRILSRDKVLDSSAAAQHTQAARNPRCLEYRRLPPPTSDRPPKIIPPSCLLLLPISSLVYPHLSPPLASFSPSPLFPGRNRVRRPIILSSASLDVSASQPASRQTSTLTSPSSFLNTATKRPRAFLSSVEPCRKICVRHDPYPCVPPFFLSPRNLLDL